MTRRRASWDLRHLGVDTASWAIGLSITVVTRYEFVLTGGQVAGLLVTIGAVMALHAVASYVKFRRFPRYAYGSFEEVRSIATLVALVALVLLVADLAFEQRPVPASAPILGGFVSLVLMLGVRYLVRLRRESRMRPDPTAAIPVLLFGAGEGGSRLARAMVRDAGGRFVPVALLDDNPALRRMQLSGVPVLGTRADLVQVAAQTGAQGVVVAIPRADAQLIRDLSGLADEAGLWIKVLPTPAELLDGRVSVSDIRDVDVADLLGRHQVSTNVDEIAGYLNHKRVLVTGAGGSIGSELCRQLNRLDLAELILLDRDESALHATLLTLHGRADLDGSEVVLADIRDRNSLDAIFARRRPDVVFHAAALKHVSLLEQYPGEAVQTNVWGTLNVLRAAESVGVERFVNVSTDKAADPINVLGLTKRLGERLTAHISRHASGVFLSVRFGNVLGSRGSVLTAFRSQIAAGGPLTVTDRNVTRYFMTIAEAVELVIQAGAVGKPGEALVLDMGSPVRIDDLARQMAAQSPRTIDIVYTGLKPGEKMSEVLLGRGEVDKRPMHPLISQVPVPPILPAEVSNIDPWAGAQVVIDALRHRCEPDAAGGVILASRGHDDVLVPAAEAER